MQRPDIHAKTDSGGCESEQIQHLGRIQNHGFLIAFSADWQTSFVSQNISDYVARTSGELLGTDAHDFLAQSAMHDISNVMQWLEPDGRPERLLDCDLFDDGNRYDLAVHLSGDGVVLEGMEAEPLEIPDPVQFVRAMLRSVKNEQDWQRFFDLAAAQLQIVSQYDRVLVYKFHPDDSGEVVAEANGSALPSYLGLRYPAGDIPKQARELYLRNVFRIIADVNAETVPLEPKVDAEGEPLDLSMSVLRSVAPVHIQYLKNMGVGASFSISIIVENRLWGMFVCHHATPKNIGLGGRMVAELMAELLSLEIESRLHAESNAVAARSREVHDRLLSTIGLHQDPFVALSSALPQLAECIDCDGCGVLIKNEFSGFGTTPRDDDVRKIARFLNRNPSHVFISESLVSEFSAANEFSDHVSGIIAIPVSRRPRDYLLFFRREEIHTVTWAGDPTKSVGNGEDLTLQPRASFAAWKEERRGHSRAWSDLDTQMAESLRVTLLEVVIRSIDHSREVDAKLRQHQDLLISELNHRIKNVFALFRGIIGESAADGLSIHEFKDVLSGRVTSLAIAHELCVKTRLKSVPVAKLLEAQFAAVHSVNPDSVVLQGPPLSLSAEAISTIALVLHELMTNAIKYGALSVSTGRVFVRWETQQDGDFAFHWIEEGGPAVTRPEGNGFGSTILRHAIPHELHGTAELDYKVTGLLADFTLPARHITETEFEDSIGTRSTVTAADSQSDASSVELSGKALLVEDNLMIAMSTQKSLHGFGFTSVELASTVSQARAAINEKQFDIAVLDVNLGAETSLPVARLLRQHGIPFVFCTGYGDVGELSGDLMDVTLVSKPYTAEELKDALKRCVAAPLE